MPPFAVAAKGFAFLHHESAVDVTLGAAPAIDREATRCLDAWRLAVNNGELGLEYNIAARSRAVMGLVFVGFDSRDGVFARPIQMRARTRPKKQARATSRVAEFFMAGFLSEISVRGANAISHNLHRLAMDGVTIVLPLMRARGLKRAGVTPGQWRRVGLTKHSGGTGWGWLIQDFSDWLLQANCHRD